jgi:hypothetical protein
MEQFEGKTLPIALDALEILDMTINEKLSRLSALPYRASRAVLIEVAKHLCDGHNVTEFWLHQNASCLEASLKQGY